jgi:CheY-like chemotaxis protein
MAMSVLIVDDDRDTRELYCLVFELNGFGTIAAANGREGLDRLRSDRPAAVVLDMMMPVLDGAGFRREQLGDPDVRDIPVVCASAYEEALVPTRLRCAAYLRKPVELDGLVRTVAAVIRHDVA